MVKRRVEIVDTDRVHTQLLHKGSISQTDIGICESVLAVRGLVRSLTSRLVVNTNNHQTFVCDCVNEVLPAHFNRVDGVSNAREQGREERERANKLSSR